MTTFDRLQDDLPVTLIELADERMPDYVDDLLGRTAASSQRPAWSFPGRWIPMADLVAERTFVPRLPWRALAVAALLALLIGGAIWFAGSRHRVPAPFGPAANGVIAYATAGDVYIGDPVTRASRVIVGGPEDDGSPVFSPSGERIAFLRAHGAAAFDLMVVALDGGTPVRVTGDPITADTTVQWTADSRSLFVWSPSTSELERLDATRQADPVVIARNVVVERGAVRPPDGRQVVFQYGDTSGNSDGLFLMDVATGQTTLVRPVDSADDHGYQFNHPKWSPDGTWISFTRQRGRAGSSDGGDDQRVFLVRPNGSEFHQAAQEPGTVVEDDVAWSPDSTRLAANRWKQNAAGDWLIQPIGVITVATGAVADAGPPPVPDGSLFDWSPDGAFLLGLPGAHATPGSAVVDAPTTIDVATGDARPLEWTVQTAVSWQRAAP
jgi:WD40-like Beta Propeller Repeat